MVKRTRIRGKEKTVTASKKGQGKDATFKKRIHKPARKTHPMKKKVAKTKSTVAPKLDKDKLDLSTTLVKMWEEFRKQKCPNRAEILQNILTNIRGRVREFAFKHDTARALQTVMKYGNNKQRLAIYDELKDSILELCKCKYSKFLVKKFLIYCPQQREEIMSFFMATFNDYTTHRNSQLVGACL
ncbi:pumilio homolog 3-like isoform X2 [Dysidea avara]|uniref:pumilio homolog 3-like isoform X2 n=1 Tax=Dysidea avara TaxID=196820 RepID=UPI00331BD23F